MCLNWAILYKVDVHKCRVQPGPFKFQWNLVDCVLCGSKENCLILAGYSMQFVCNEHSKLEGRGWI
jgi:hypothetical protein